MIKRVVLAAFACLMLAGCSSLGNIQVIETNDKQHEAVGNSFSDEKYIWENWSYSNEQVKEVK